MENAKEHRQALRSRINIYQAESMALKLLNKSKRLYMISDKRSPSFIWVSRSWVDYLGWSFEELTSQPFTNLIHPDDLKESMEIFAQFQKTGKLGFTGTFTNRYLTKRGFYKPIVWEDILQTEGNDYMMEALIPE